MLVEIVHFGSRELKLIYLVIFVFLTYVFSYVFPITISTIFGLCLSVFLIQELFIFNKDIQNDSNKELKQKLDYLNMVMDQGIIRQRTDIGLRKDTYAPGFEPSSDISSYLYLEPNLINLLYSVKDYETYSGVLYGKVLRTTNYVLKLSYDIQLKNENNKTVIKNCAQHYKAAQKLINVGTNYFNAFVCSLPTYTYYGEKFKNSLFRYRLLMRRVSDKMKKACLEQQKQEGINISTIHISEFDEPSPYNERGDSTFYWFN